MRVIGHIFGRIMEKIKNLVCLMVAFLLSSCSFEDRDSDFTGQPIRFGATVERYEPETRTAYSDVVVNGKERIDWVAGDEIMIYMYYETRTYYNNVKNGYDRKPYVIINPITDNGYISDAKVGTYDDPLVWSEDYKEENVWTGSKNEDLYWPYNFYFYGIYPAMDVLNLNNNSPIITFNLPAEQPGDMSLAYMAATTTQLSYTTAGKGTVILQFYPMVTTLWFVLKNDSKADIIINNIKISSRQQQGGDWSHKPVAGTYHAILNNREFVIDDPYNEGDKSVTISVNKRIGIGDVIEIPAFIRPKTYETSLLDVTINFSQGGVQKEISNCLGENQSDITALLPLKKYNIGIKLSGNGVTIDPPVDPEPGRLNNAAAQIILSIIKSGGGNNWSYEDFADYFKKYFGFNSQNDFNEKFWNDKDGVKGFNSALDDALKDLDNISSFLDKWFPGNKLDGLLVEMAKLEEINLGEGTPGVLLDILEKEDFSSFFPNVRKITIKVPKNITIKLYNLSQLEEIVFEGGYDVNVKIILVNCPDDVSIDKGNNYKVTVEHINE